MYKNVLDLEMVLELRSVDIAQIDKTSVKKLYEQLNPIGSFEHISALLDANPYKCRKSLEESIQALDENNGIEMAFYCDKYYKCGFADAINLILDCVKPNEEHKK